ncbi:RNA-processing protein [Candidatus Woesearchaeota archaeon]|nr:RNA-processing protein [Candidatus Woesearchaeota archaeon]
MLIEYNVKIPKERIAVLIGKQAEIKKRLEKRTKIKITVDSESGDVDFDSDDAVKSLVLENVIKAIGRGFNPEIAEILFNEDFCFDIINLKDYVKTKNDFARIKSRLIGRNGGARENLERLSNTNISVYGKTVAIIARFDRIVYTREALISLITGAPHAHVYEYLEKVNHKLEQGKEL